MGRKRSGLEHNRISLPSGSQLQLQTRSSVLGAQTGTGVWGGAVPRRAQTPALPCSVHTAASPQMCAVLEHVSQGSREKQNRQDVNIHMYTLLYVHNT